MKTIFIFRIWIPIAQWAKYEKIWTQQVELHTIFTLEIKSRKSIFLVTIWVWKIVRIVLFFQSGWPFRHVQVLFSFSFARNFFLTKRVWDNIFLKNPKSKPFYCTGYFSILKHCALPIVFEHKLEQFVINTSDIKDKLKKNSYFFYNIDTH